MAKAFAKPFYNSKAWKECRKAYINSVNGLCEICMEKGKIVPGNILHHKEYITPDNITDAYLTLGWDNLMYVCTECHNHIHYSYLDNIREDVMFDSNGELIEKE